MQRIITIIIAVIAAAAANVPAAAVLPIGPPEVAGVQTTPSPPPARQPATPAKIPPRALDAFGWAVLVGGFGIVGLAAHWRRRPMVVSS